MSDIKERILGAISIMSDKEAAKIWDLILATFALENAEEVQPDESEHSAFRAFLEGEPEYQPSISQEDLLKELNF